MKCKLSENSIRKGISKPGELVLNNFLAIVFTVLLGAGLLVACSKDHDDSGAPKGNIEYKAFDKTLKTYTPQSGTERFEFTYWIDYEETSLQFYSSLGFAMYWDLTPNGYYILFNNSIGEILTDGKGLVKGLDAGYKIDGNSAGNWDQFAALAYDYEKEPATDRGALAGKGDKYIAVRIWDDEKEGSKYYYGWVKLNVSANGRNVKLIDMGIQLDKNTSLNAGQR